MARPGGLAELGHLGNQGRPGRAVRGRQHRHPAPGRSGSCQDPLGFTLTAIDESGSTDETPIPGGTLRFVHVVAPHENGAMITHRVQIEDAAELSARLGPAITEDLPEAMAGLVALAEARRVPGHDADAASSVA